MYRHGVNSLAGPCCRAHVMWVWSHDGSSETETVPLEPPSARTDIRMELVQRVRREIAEGTYDTPEKMQVALDRLLDRLEQAN